MMYQEPEKSPWGKVQTCDLLCPGVFLVSTASHGGTMVSKEVAAFLSPAAKRCGFQRGGYLCFEEDTQEEVSKVDREKYPDAEQEYRFALQDIPSAAGH